jgi:DNA-binding transcriptional MerR regulator
MFKIGDFSKFSRVSVKTLRHYDELGLLKPAYVDAATSYRYYSADQLPRLNRIIALKELGFTLEQIAPLLDDDLSADQLKGMLKLKRAEIEQQLQAEEQKLARVEARLRSIELETGLPAYEIIVRQVEPHRVASIRQRLKPGQDTVEAMFEEVEAYVARYRARAAYPPLALFHDAEYQEQEADIEVAVPIASVLPESERVAVYELPGVEHMACTIHTGSYMVIDRAYQALFTWLAVHGYRLAGPGREVYLRFGADNIGYELPAAFLTNEAAAYVTELQLPITKVSRLAG